MRDHGDLILPDNVPAYEFLNLEGDKFSTSRNWAVWLHEYMESYPEKSDELKYVLTSIAPESKDSEFTWKEFQTRINSELADILGNFVNRAMVLTQKYYQGIVPEKGELTEEDQRVLKEMNDIPDRIAKLVYAYKLRDAQAEAMNLARLGNKYLAETEPWKLVKTDVERVKTIMNIALQITANLSIVLQPFLPATAKKLSEFLNFHTSDWTNAGRDDLLKTGQMTSIPSILFTKIEDELVAFEVAKLIKTDENVSAFEPQKDAYNCLVLNVGNDCKTYNTAIGDNQLFSMYEQTHGNLGARSLDLGGNQKAVPLDLLIDKADFIKIDAEGFEPFILDGCKRILETTPLVAIEINHPGLSKYGFTEDDILKHFKNYIAIETYFYADYQYDLLLIPIDKYSLYKEALLKHPLNTLKIKHIQ